MKNLFLSLFLPVILVLFIAFKSSEITYDYPEFLHELYDEPIYKFICLILLYFIANKDFTLGLLLSIVILFILLDYQLLSEGFESYGPVLNNCSIYSKGQIETTGTANYPLHDNNLLKTSPHYEGEIQYNN